MEEIVTKKQIMIFVSLTMIFVGVILMNWFLLIVGSIAMITAATLVEERPVFFIGETIQRGDLVFTVNGVRESKGYGSIYEEGVGYIFKIVDATVENVGKQSAIISSTMFSLTNSADWRFNNILRAYDINIAPRTIGSLDGELSPGHKMRGELVFEISRGVKRLTLLFRPNILGFRQAIVLLDVVLLD